MKHPYRLDLLFEAHAGHVAHIQLVSSMKDEHGRTVLSPECRTLGELEYAVNRLREDLDRILATAAKRFDEPRPPLYTDS